MALDIAEHYLSEPELAAMLGRTTRTLRRWHARREGPPRIKIGSKILYNRRSVLEFIESRAVHPIGVGK